MIREKTVLFTCIVDYPLYVLYTTHIMAESAKINTLSGEKPHIYAVQRTES